MQGGWEPGGPSPPHRPLQAPRPPGPLLWGLSLGVRQHPSYLLSSLICSLRRRPSPVLHVCCARSGLGPCPGRRRPGIPLCRDQPMDTTWGRHLVASKSHVTGVLPQHPTRASHPLLAGRTLRRAPPHESGKGTPGLPGRGHCPAGGIALDRDLCTLPVGLAGHAEQTCFTQPSLWWALPPGIWDICRKSGAPVHSAAMAAGGLLPLSEATARPRLGEGARGRPGPPSINPGAAAGGESHAEIKSEPPVQNTLRGGRGAGPVVCEAGPQHLGLPIAGGPRSESVECEPRGARLRALLTAAPATSFLAAAGQKHRGGAAQPAPQTCGAAPRLPRGGQFRRSGRVAPATVLRGGRPGLTQGRVSSSQRR